MIAQMIEYGDDNYNEFDEYNYAVRCLVFTRDN